MVEEVVRHSWGPGTAIAIRNGNHNCLSRPGWSLDFC